MKKLFGLVAVVLLPLFANAQTTQTLPELNVIKDFTFSKQYSCGGSYETSVLFLTEYSKSNNSPELEYNGTCQNNAYINVNTHGGNFSLVSDLGDVPLEAVTAFKALNWGRRNNVFKATAPVILNHTYVVFYTSGDIEALYTFKVTAYDPQGAMKIRYAVKKYQINTATEESQGFGWEIGNH